MRICFTLFLLAAFCANAFSQNNQDKVSQLIAATNYFNKKVNEKGLIKAFLDVSDASSLAFRPDPVSLKKYYRDQPDSIGYLQLDPLYAQISKSGDWGYISGNYTFKQNEHDYKKFYGTYISIWKKNKKGYWRLAMDAGISHKKPTKLLKKRFINPENEVFLHQRSTNRLQQREDIVLSTDVLLSTITKADNKIAQNEFLTDDSRLIFPGYEPITGKKNIMEFWKKKGLKAITEPIKADRSYSGEIAYTYGKATIQAKKYNYIRIWEVQTGHKWNVILELFTEDL